jgi:hypothetical protein
LLALIVLLLVAPWQDSDGSASSSQADAASLGYYPPAPSTAVGMTPEWREFADEVDRTCAVSFNYALGAEAQTRRVAKAQGWSYAHAEAAIVSVWADEDMRILLATAKMGEPPRRADLFARWRSNVAHRTQLFRQASQVSRVGDFSAEKRIFDEIDRLKKRSDELGQRFGLRICTSN